MASVGFVMNVRRASDERADYEYDLWRDEEAA